VTGWIAETWELRPKPLFQLSGVHALALSPNGRHVAVCDQVDSSVRVWDLNAGCFVYESVPLSPGSTKKDPFWCCSFTHDSQHIIVWERNGSMLHLLSMRERGIVQSSSLTLKKNHIGRAASFLISHVEPCSSSNQLICQDEDGELQHVQFPGGTAGMGGNRGDPIEIDREGGAPLESPRITPSSGSIPRREPPPPSAFRPLDLEQNLAAIAAAYPEFNRAPASADAAGGRAPSLEPSIFTSRPTAAAASSSSSSAPVSSAAPMPSLSSAGRRLGAPLVKQEEHRLEEQLKDKSAVKVARARKRKAEETAVHLREKAARLEEQKHAAEDEADHERQMRVHTERDVRREKRARGVEREQLVEARVKAEEVIEQIAEERDAAMEDRDRFEQEMQRARELSAAPSCSVCQDAPPSVLFLSCNHLTVCRPCNLELMNNRGEGPKRCPICRKAVVGELPVVIP
jgi:hypothetical protein